MEDIKKELGCYSKCVVNHLFTSNRQEGCKTIEDFYNKRFDRKSSPLSPKFLYYKKEHYEQLDLFEGDNNDTI